MLRVALVGFVAAFALCAQPAPPPAAPTLAVYMDFDATPGVSALAIMQHEVDGLLKPAGIAVNWRLARENKGDEEYSRLVVLRFTGECQAELVRTTDTEETLSLGDAKVVRGRVLPFSEVRCDEVRKALSFLAP